MLFRGVRSIVLRQPDNQVKSSLLVWLQQWLGEALQQIDVVRCCAALKFGLQFAVYWVQWIPTNPRACRAKNETTL